MSGTRKSMGNFVTMLVLFPLTIVVNILVTRILGPSDKGIFSFLMLIGESLLPIMYLGFGVGVIYFVSAEKYRASRVTMSLLTIGLVNGILVTGLIYLLWHNQWLGETAKEIKPEYMLPVLAVLPLSGIQTMAKQLFKGTSQFGLLNIITLADQISTGLLLLALVIVTGLKLEGAVWAVVIKKIIGTGAVLYLVYRHHRPQWRVDIPFIRDCYRYGIRAWVGNMATRANDRFDQLLLGFFASPALLGYYSVAYSLVRFMGLLPQAIAPVMFNMIAKANDVQRSAQVVARVHRVLLILVGLSGLALGISAYWLIPFLYGEAFRQAVLPAIILLPGMFVYMASRRVINKFLSASGKPEKTSMVEGFGAVIGLVSYLILIPLFDLIGAAVGSTLAYFASTAMAHYFFRQMVPKGTVNMFRIGWKDLQWMWQKVEGSFGIIRRIRQKLFKSKKP